MARPPVKPILIALAVIAAAGSIFLMKRRVPACSGEGKFMSTRAECQAWGVAPEVCETAIAKARDVLARSAPKMETMFKCELRFSDCFENPAGGFSPRPSFCLKADGEPTEIRYLEYESDRRNRKQTKEVRVN